MTQGIPDETDTAKQAAELTAQDAQKVLAKVAIADDAAGDSVKASTTASSAATLMQSNLQSEAQLEGETATTKTDTEKVVSSTQDASNAAKKVAEKIADAKVGAETVAADAADAAAKAQDAAVNGAKETPQALIATAITTGYYDLLKSVVLDHRLSGADKKEILVQLKEITPTSDRLTYRTAIILLGIIAIITICAVWNLMWNGKTVSDGLIAIASGAVGGLAGLLSPSKNSDPHS